MLAMRGRGRGRGGYDCGYDSGWERVDGGVVFL
jgi:hypothetical protein